MEFGRHLRRAHLHPVGHAVPERAAGRDQLHLRRRVCECKRVVRHHYGRRLGPGDYGAREEEADGRLHGGLPRLASNSHHAGGKLDTPRQTNSYNSYGLRTHQ